MKFRKKPVVIEAIQWTGTNWQEIADWSRQGHRPTEGWPVTRAPGSIVLSVDTLEGETRAVIGHWIIKGIAGEFYPCEPSIFDRTYEAVNRE